MIYKEWLDNWLELYIKSKVKTRTYEKYCDLIRLHINPNLGDCELEDLSAITLQKFVVDLSKCGNKKTGAGLSANTIASIITILQSSLKQAVLLGLINKQYANKITRPKTKEKEIQCLTLSEQKTIEKYIFNSKKAKLFGVILTLYTGLRIGELLALEWSDIDLKNGLISVTKTCYDKKDGRHIDTPKTATSKRIIPLPKQLLPHLKELQKSSKTQYVVSCKNTYVGVRSYQRTFELLLKKLHISHKGFHALRHTFATRAIECGMDVKTLSEILGHKNPTITLNRYTHSLLEHKTLMMNRLGKLL